MGRGFFNSSKPKYIKTVSFVGCKDANEKELKRKQLISDNAVFLNSALALVTDRDRPFLEDEDYKAFLKYMQSKRMEFVLKNFKKEIVVQRLANIHYFEFTKNFYTKDVMLIFPLST